MPELPDVDGFRQVAQGAAVGRRIDAVTVDDDRVLRTTTPQGLGQALSGATVEAAERHGKWLWLRTDATSDLLLHFGMTGGLHTHADDDPGCEHDRLALRLASGTRLALQMQRLLGGAWLVRSDDEGRAITGQLGPDARRLDAAGLRERLADSRATLKSALMDQERVAGLGNELADEVCWQVRVHPGTSCRDLDDDGWAAVARTLSRVLDVGVDQGQVPRGEGFLNDVREDDDPHCPRCGTRLRRGTVAGRTTWWCPQDQPAP